MRQACPAEPNPDRYRRGRGRPPRRVPHLGQVLRLDPRDMRYRVAPLTIRVREVRLDLSTWYDGDWVWVEGEELEPGGIVVGWRQVLVRVDAIPT